jgi:putative transposase
MPRPLRRNLVERGSTNHYFWRALDHAYVFEEPGAREHFIELLLQYKERFGVRIYAWNLMSTHPHVITNLSEDQPEYSAFWKVVNQRFARWYNQRRGRRGQVIMERPGSPRIQEGGCHQLEVMRYVDLNAVRAGLVKSPKDWEHSSYAHYAFGRPDPLVDDAPEYLALGRTGPERRKAYQAFYARPVSETVRQRRSDLVDEPFIGDEEWVQGRRRASGMPPRRGADG